MDKIILFFVLLYNFFVKKFRFNWIKFTLTTLALLFLTWYYINCQKIFFSSNVITIDRLLGNDSLIDVRIDSKIMSSIFESAFYKGIVDQKNWGNTVNIIGIKALADSTANIFSKEKMCLYPDTVRERYELYKNLIEQQYKGSNIDNLIEKIDAVYHFSFQSTKPNYSGQLIEDLKFKTDSFLVFCDFENAYEDADIINYEIFLAYDKEISLIGNEAYNYPFGLILSNYKLFSYLSPIDISKLYYEIYVLKPTNVPEKENISAFSVDFMGHTEFSEMSPTPDYIDLSSIKFNTEDKLNQLNFNGVYFHAKLTDNETVQNTRIFIITALMSGLFAYWATLFYSLIITIVNSIRNNK